MVLKGRNEIAMRELDKAFTPDIIYIMDHMVEHDNGSGALCRLAIHKKQECYEVRKYKIVTTDVNREVMSELLGRKVTEWEAKDILNQEVVCLEQNGWNYISDESFVLENIMDSVDDRLLAIKHISAISHFEAPKLLSGRFVEATPIYAGVRIIVAIDNNLSCWCTPTAHANGFKWERGSQRIRECLTPLAVGRGKKGLVVECFVGNNTIWVTRPIYYCGQWIDQANDEKHTIALKEISLSELNGVKALCATKVSINALSALIYGDRAGVMVRQGAACYIVGDQIKNISFSAGYEKNYRINCESSGEKLSDAEMRYLPDMSYYSMHCAVNNKNAAYF